MTYIFSAHARGHSQTQTKIERLSLIMQNCSFGGGEREGGERGQGNDTGVGNQTGSDKLADHCCEVGGDGLHAVLEVIIELCPVFADRDNLVAQVSNVFNVLVGNLKNKKNPIKLIT